MNYIEPPKLKLGTLKSVNLRDYWKKEATDFTRWLANEENIVILTDELDIEIENVRCEEPTGRFHVDIIADEVNTNRKVIIENQLETTDHKHLGQLLTYASGHDASIIIWVVKEYTEEHKQAIDWFNRHMPEQISFFLVQIELWQIGNSDLAPKFNIVSQPNNWANTIKNASKTERNNHSDLKLQQQKFWEKFKEFADDKKSNLRVGRTPRPRHYFNINFGTSKAVISLTFNTKNNNIGCELYIRNDDNIYNTIKNDEGQIKNLLGEELEFMDLPERTAFRIVKYYNCDPTDETRWNEYFNWLKTEAERFQKVFKKYF